MPTIRIDYDDGHIDEAKMRELAEAMQRIVSEITGIEDTFVYAQSPTIKIKAAPIEIFVQMSKTKIENVDELFGKIKERLVQWKQVAEFNYPINLTLMPMEWKFEVNI